MKGRTQTFLSWRFTCLALILLLVNFPLSHQVKKNQTETNLSEKVVFYELGSETPQGSPSGAPKPSGIGISDERLQDVGSCGGGLGSSSPFPVQLHTHHDHVTLDNGLIQVTISKPGGLITALSHGGMDNVLEFRNPLENRGYWDIVSGALGQRKSVQDRLEGTEFRVIKEDKNQIELSFLTTWDQSSNLVPLNVDKRFILMRGCSGFYSYAIFERLEGWPGFFIGETRIAFKLRKDKFRFMAISDNRQRVMPMPDDRSTSRSQKLDYGEAVRLTNPSNPFLKGEVDDKYQYSSEDQDIKVHGWISSDPNVGFWVITPSNEFRAGGPVKQDLTSHVGPTSLAMFHSCHYAGQELEATFQDGEPWKKVFGPVLIYLNSASSNTEDPHATLWQDAKRQMMMEVESWPYNFPLSEDFPKSGQRGSVNGRLMVHNRFSNEEYVLASNAYVGLARPGPVGSWQKDSKGYQFWTRADANGSFSIRNVHPREYNLFAWVPGFIGDYKYDINLTIYPGRDNNLGVLIYDPPRDGPTIWEIGVPDRTAAEFNIPDPNPKYINKLYADRIDTAGRLVKSFDKFRQYGLWERYGELHPNEDLIYRIGVNDYSKDWYFAQSSRRVKESFQETTWQVKFNLANVNYAGTYRLRVALASATLAELEVRFNNKNTLRAHFKTGRIGFDNSIARHGIHGLYWLYNIDVPSYRLVRGENTIFFTQSRTNGPFVGIMYDYIRLEGPSVMY